MLLAIVLCGALRCFRAYASPDADQRLRTSSTFMLGQVSGVCAARAACQVPRSDRFLSTSGTSTLLSVTPSTCIVSNKSLVL